jgi:hypothetical protein
MRIVEGIYEPRKHFVYDRPGMQYRRGEEEA